QAALTWWHHQHVAVESGHRDYPLTLEDVRAWALALPRTADHLIRDYVQLRVARLVYAAVSPGETSLGFVLRGEERAARVAAEADRFLLERASDARYNWIDARMATLDVDEAHEFIVDAWRMVVPKRIAAQVARDQIRGTQST